MSESNHPHSVPTLRKRLSIKPEWFFLYAAIFLQLMYAWLVPPFQSPDEYNHFYRALQVSQGNFLPEKSGNRVGGHLPACVDELTLPFLVLSNNPAFKYEPAMFKRLLNIKCQAEHKVFKDFPNTANYSALSYLPQATAIALVRSFEGSITWQYLGGRLAIIITWILAMFLVIRILPLHKWLFTALLLLPMHVFIAGSFSADTVTNILAFLFIALVLRFSLSNRELTPKDLILFLLLGCGLAIAKLVYAGLLLLLFMIPSLKFRSALQKNGFILLVIALAALTALTWSSVFMEYYVPYAEYDEAWRNSVTLSPGANYHAQKELLAARPWLALEVLFNSLLDAEYYLTSFVGGFGTYMALPIHWPVAAGAYVFLLLIVITERTAIKISGRNKLIMLAGALAAFSLLILSQHLTWNPVGKTVVNSLQGRYLIPLFPLILLLFSNPFPKIKFNSLLPLLALTLFLHIYAAGLVYRKFIESPYRTVISFDCDFESTDAPEHFNTSDPSVNLHGAGYRSRSVKYDGNYALALPPGQSGALFAFRDLGFGDLVEVEVWVKGKGGRIVMTGCGDVCGDYFFDNTLVQVRNASGWGKLNMTFAMPVGCYNSSDWLYLNNNGDSTVYFDELSFRVKKCFGETCAE